MSILDTLQEQAARLVTTASGTALDAYSKKLGATSAPAAAVPTAEKKRNWPLIGGIVAVVIGLVIWLVKRK